jgi:hypothetical protein
MHVLPSFVHHGTSSFTVKRVPVPIFSPSSFVCSPKRLFSTRRSYILHRSFLQGHILPSQGPVHPRPVPLVSQVVLSQCVIDWGKDFGVTSSPSPFLFSFSFMPPPPPRPPLFHVLKPASSVSLLLFFRTQLWLLIIFLKFTSLSLPVPLPGGPLFSRLLRSNGEPDICSSC